MYIQYAGFDLQADSRTYNFHVIDVPGEAREFKVNLGESAFGSSPLKIQDGPGISMARLKRELAFETSASPAEPNLRVEPRDIQEYVEKTYPKPAKKSGIGSDS
jgi:hypothetical protein